MEGAENESGPVRRTVKTEVSYAPTKSFAEAFPEEVAKQSKKFVRPSWSRDFDILNEPSAPPQQSARVPQRNEIFADGIVIGAGAVLLVVAVAFLAWRSDFFSGQ